MAACPYSLKASPETVHWGYFDPGRDPVLSVPPGTRMTIESVSGNEEVTPETGFMVLPGHREIHRRVTRRMEPGHILTGPVEVSGAQPGDVLVVRILEVELTVDWGWNIVRPGSGTLPEDFTTGRVLQIPIDRARKAASPPWGGELPLKPFFGVMGVAPPDEWGVQSSIPPQAFGGNIDCKELGPGATLYLPVFKAGALFSCGDGHAAQGDGEVCLTAIETCLRGTFQFDLLPGAHAAMPWAETATHHVTFGFHPDLDEAARQAVRQMIALIGSLNGMAAEDAYVLCSLAADLHVTQLVNHNKGVHMMLDKSLLER